MPAKLLLSLSLVLTLCFASLAAPVRADDEDTVEVDPWITIRKDLFADKPIVENDGMLTIEAPEKAEDSAMVPVTVSIAGKVSRDVKSLTLVIDRNPSPVVARIAFGAAAGESSRKLSTRVRFDSYSWLRAIIETSDGTLHMTQTFVKAAGGCSSIALKDAEEAAQHIGEMRIGYLGALPRFKSNEADRPMGEAQVMIRHPNTSGMQMNPQTREYIPARFVNEIEVKRGDNLILKMEAGISIATNPTVRFTYELGPEPIGVYAKDTDGAEFKGKGPLPSI
jgi:sulfur-oxidizing protein SoxY